jgi:hypothetical protein
MYGKIYESIYSGSMVGAGLDVFAVWGYVLANTRRGLIELNPKLLAFILGGTEQEVAHAIHYLCQPDTKSRSKVEGGRRLIKESEYQYRVVNWDDYQKIRDENDRREYNKRKQSEYRARVKNCGTDRERRAAKAYADGDIEEGDRISAEGLPTPTPAPAEGSA